MPIETILHITGNSFAWSGKYSVGVYLHKETREAYLFDCGPDQRTAELIDREIKNKGYEIAAVILSHGHYVNTGGSAFLKKQYPNLRVYATHLSAPFINNPALFSALSTISHTHNLYSEFSELSESAILTDIIPFKDDVFEINGIPFIVHTLPGHFPGMIGIQTPDQVLYCADALFGSSTLSKQKLLFFTEPNEAKLTLEKLEMIHAKHYVLYHGGIYNNISDLIQENVTRLDDAYDDVLALIEQQWQTPENITQRIMSKYDFENNEKQFDLAHSIGQSYIKLLLKEAKITPVIRNGLLFYTNNKTEQKSH